MKIKYMQTKQIQAVKAALCSILENTLLAIYLHGSAVAGGLRPQSDIDHPMTDEERRKLLAILLQISGRHPATSEDQRCIELMIFLKSDLSDPIFPTRVEFIYGEWLRDDFEAGKIPTPMRDPENTLILAQARLQSITLSGKDALVILPEISMKNIYQAMGELIPTLLNGLQGDERNVLLTLARMWYTATTGKFVAKDTAATWAIQQMSDQDTSILDYARLAYLNKLNLTT